MSELHPPNCMPLELQVAHYIKQVVDLREMNAELVAALRGLANQLASANAAYLQAMEVLAKADMRDVEKEMNALAALGGLLE